MQIRKLIGGILMILGTSVGAGMLALPVATASTNTLATIVMLVICWLVMTIAAFAILEVNLWLPSGSNLITMARKTLGLPGEFVTWLTYLLLLYSLLCAYIAGSNDVTLSLFSWVNLHLYNWLSVLLTTLILGSIVFRGINSVDVVNRFLMSAKLVLLLFLVFVFVPQIKMHYLAMGGHAIYLEALMVIITSFGYAIIVPSLRVYFSGDVKLLRLIIAIGSLIPLLIYIVWVVVIQGVLPRYGVNSLMEVAHSQHPVAALMAALTANSSSNWLSGIANIFISISAITSFLGVALCLTDFIADGLRISKQGYANWLIYGLTFLPPVLIVVLAPTVFIKALSYAGVMCVILLMVLPMLMFLVGKYLRCLTR